MFDFRPISLNRITCDSTSGTKTSVYLKKKWEGDEAVDWNKHL